MSKNESGTPIPIKSGRPSWHQFTSYNIWRIFEKFMNYSWLAVWPTHSAIVNLSMDHKKCIKFVKNTNGLQLPELIADNIKCLQVVTHLLHESFRALSNYYTKATSKVTWVLKDLTSQRNVKVSFVEQGNQRDNLFSKETKDTISISLSCSSSLFFSPVPFLLQSVFVFFSASKIMANRLEASSKQKASCLYTKLLL